MTGDSQELLDLQVTARAVFTDLASSAAVHAVIDAGGGRDSRLERQLMELGFYTVLVDGDGAALPHLLRIVTEAGTATATTRLLGHAVGAGSALAACHPSEAKDAVTSRVASGALCTVTGLSPSTGRFIHQGGDGSWTISGSATFVPDADDTEFVLAWSTGDDGPLVAAVPATELSITRLRTIDRTRVLSHVKAAEVPVSSDQVLASGEPARALGRTVTLAMELALAHDSLGVARRALDLTTDYARTRHQFGRPIGSFQAVKHQAADMATRLELSRSACDGALSEVLDCQPTAHAAVAAAKELTTSNASWIAGRAIQLHGGIGYTWEHDAHVLLKRATLSERLVSSGRERRILVLDDLLDGLDDGPPNPIPMATGDAQ